MALADLNNLINASAQNLSQFKGLTAAYVVTGFGVPTQAGFAALINENNSTNFGAGGTTVFNDENIYINTLNALYQGNPDAKAAFDAKLAGASSQIDKLNAIYNATVPLAAQTDAGRAYFQSQVQFYTDRAAELKIAGVNGFAVVAQAALAKIVVDNDIGGLGDSINDLVAAVADGSAQIPEAGDAFTPIEDADGAGYDGDDADMSAGRTFILTEGADLGAQAGQPFFGTEGNDVYIAGTVNAGPLSGNTLGSGDNLNGSEGTDTLQIIHDGNPMAGNLLPQITSIENVTVQATGAPVVIDLRNAVGVEKIESARSGGTVVDFINVVNDVVIGINDAVSDVNVHFLGPVVTDGEIEVELAGGQAGASATHLTVDVTGSEVTTLSVSSTGVANENWENVLEVDFNNNAADLETLNVDGDSAIYIEDMAGDFATLTSVNVTNTGDTWINLTSNNSDLAIVSGEGDDRFDLDANEVNSDDSFEGGAGDDNLWLHFDDSVDLLPSTGPADPISAVIGGVNNATGFEALTIDIGDAYIAGAGTDISLDASLFTTINHFNFTNHDADDLSGAILVEKVADTDSFSAWADINAGATFNAATGSTILNLEIEGDANVIATNGFKTVNLAVDNEGSATDIGLLDTSANTTTLVTGAAEVIRVNLGNAAGQTFNASALVTEGEIDIDRSGPTTVVNSTADANIITGGGSKDTLIGTAQDDVLDGGSVFVPAPDGVTTVNLNNLYNLDANADGTDDTLVGVSIDVDGITYTAAAGSAVSAALALSGLLIDAGYDASAEGGIVTIVSANNIAPVVANVEAEVAIATEAVDVDGGTTYTPAVLAAASSGTLTFNTASGSFGIGQTINIQFTDATGANVPISYLILAEDVLPGDAVATASNVAAKVLAAIIGDAVLGPLVTATRDGNEVSFETVAAGNTNAGESWNVTANDAAGITVDQEDGVDAVAASDEILTLTDYTPTVDGELSVTVDGITATIAGVAGVTITGIAIADALRAADGAAGAFDDVNGSATIKFNAGNATLPDVSGSYAAGNASLPQSNDGEDAAPNNTADDIVVSVDGADETVYTADIYTGGDGSDLFLVQTANINGLSPANTAAAADVITDFVYGTDLISFDLGGVAGSATNYVEGPVGGHGNFNGALAQAISDFAANADLRYSAQQVGNDVFIFAETSVVPDATPDQVVQLIGVTLADLGNNGNFIVA